MENKVEDLRNNLNHLESRLNKLKETKEVRGNNLKVSSKKKKIDELDTQLELEKFYKEAKGTLMYNWFKSFVTDVLAKSLYIYEYTHKLFSDEKDLIAASDKHIDETFKLAHEYLNALEAEIHKEAKHD